MVQVTFVETDGTRHAIDIVPGENVMRGAVNQQVPGIIGECGGGLACATCHCYIDAAWVGRISGTPSQDETDMLGSAAAEIRTSSRLACQIVVEANLDGLVVHLPDRQF